MLGTAIGINMNSEITPERERREACAKVAKNTKKCSAHAV
jgi:hypothetical protein